MLQKKLDLECRLEEEQMRRESEKVELERSKALLSTRVKQLQDHSKPWAHCHSYVVCVVITPGPCMGT